MFKVLLTQLLPLLAFVVSNNVRADLDLDLEAITTSSKLPSPRYEISTLYDGQDSIFVVGGSSGSHEILKYSVSSDQIEIVGHVSPDHVVVQSGSAAWEGPAHERIIYFGGEKCEGSDSTCVMYDEVLGLNLSSSSRSNPNPGNLAVTAEVLSHVPEPSSGTSAFLDLDDDAEGNIYIVGGKGRGRVKLDSILKYSVARRKVELVAFLPKGRVAPTVVRDARAGAAVAYIFGGFSNSGYLDDILRFDPKLRTVTKLNVTLPLPMAYSCAVWTGTEAYIIGGQYDPEEDSRETTSLDWLPVVKFNPSTNEVVEVEVKNFPRKLALFGCTFVEKLNRIYVLGGYAIEAEKVQDEIMYIQL